MRDKVAVFGRFCAGKTTLANALEDEYGFTRVSMAANMKSLVRDAYGTDDKSATVTVIGQDGTPRETTIRDVLQALGQNAKGHDLHFWLRLFLNDTRFMDGFPLVMDDARLRFEADALRKEGWLLVRIEVPEAVRMDRHQRLYGRLPTASQMAHPTETESDLIDVDLVLDGTIDPSILAEMVIAAL